MNTEELKCTMHNPFGPMILSVDMTKHHTDELIKLSENNSNRKNMDSRLAGQIESEPMLSHEELNSLGYTEIFCNIGKSYVMQRSTVYNEKLHNINVSLQAAWIVSQKQNEYNPVHMHGGHVSGAGFLKVPKTFGKHIQEEKAETKNYAGGTLNLIHGSKQFLSKATFHL